MARDFNSLSQEVLAAVGNRVLPGAVIALGHEGKTELIRAFGARRVEPEVAPASADTVYDLASLTKPLVTSLLVMKAIERGALGLGQPLGDFFPPLRGQPATVRLALAHAAGFPAHRKYYETFRELWTGPSPSFARAQIVACAASEPLAYPPGARSLYSDLGFILLGDVVERVLGDRLDRLAERLLFQPLGLRGLGFVDLAAGPGTATLRGRPVAPTERCPVRGRMIVGEVHDLNAFAMGGIAGHAGLFGSAEEVLNLVFALCRAYQGQAAAVVAAEVLRECWRPSGVPGSTWRLGWDGPAEHGSLAGQRISRRAVGHLSFTGCSLWLDPEQASCVLVLANRIHPEVKDDPRFRALRPALADAALQALAYEAR